MFDDLVEQRAQAIARVAHVIDRPALLAAGVEVGKVQLFVVGPDRREQVESVIQHPIGISMRAVDLVQHHDRLQSKLERLAEHELGLRHYTFLGIHQKQAAVDHAQNSLYLAAKVRVAWRVDDIDAGFAGHAMPQHGRRLGQDRDASFTLLVIGVHRPFGLGFIGSENAGLRQHLVDQSCLAMIDVRDDGDIA